MSSELEPITLDALVVEGAEDDGPPGGADQWQRTLDLVTEWLGEHRGNSRTTYADAIGYPVNVTTGQRRDVSTLRNGVAWLPWCLVHQVDPLDARRKHVVAWINALDTTPHPNTGRMLAKGTRSQMVAVVSALYRWLVQEGHAEVNPVQVNRKKMGVSTAGDASPTRSLTGEEVTLLQLAADRDRIASVRLRSSAIVATLFGIGMRVSELVGLDLDELKVMQGRRAIPIRLKGGRIHWVAVPDAAIPRIDAYLASRADLEKRPAMRGQVNSATRPLFVTGRGNRMHRTEVNTLLRRLARDAGLVEPDTIHPHVARHSWITKAREEGVAASDIQQHVGHVSEQTTARYGQHALNLERSPVNIVANSYLPPLRTEPRGETDK